MKYWKALVAAAMVLTLSACGGGGDGSDKSEPPPPPPGTPDSLTISASTPVLTPDGQLSVQFNVADNRVRVTTWALRSPPSPSTR